MYDLAGLARVFRPTLILAELSREWQSSEMAAREGIE
jgi:hypothetical protein